MPYTPQDLDRDLLPYIQGGYNRGKSFAQGAYRGLSDFGERAGFFTQSQKTPGIQKKADTGVVSPLLSKYNYEPFARGVGNVAKGAWDYTKKNMAIPGSNFSSLGRTIQGAGNVVSNALNRAESGFNFSSEVPKLLRQYTQAGISYPEGQEPEGFDSSNTMLGNYLKAGINEPESETKKVGVQPSAPPKPATPSNEAQANPDNRPVTNQDFWNAYTPPSDQAANKQVANVGAKVRESATANIAPTPQQVGGRPGIYRGPGTQPQNGGAFTGPSNTEMMMNDIGSKLAYNYITPGEASRSTAQLNESQAGPAAMLRAQTERQFKPREIGVQNVLAQSHMLGSQAEMEKAKNQLEHYRTMLQIEREKSPMSRFQSFAEHPEYQRIALQQRNINPAAVGGIVNPNEPISIANWRTALQPGIVQLLDAAGISSLPALAASIPGGLDPNHPHGQAIAARLLEHLLSPENRASFLTEYPQENPWDVGQMLNPRIMARRRAMEQLFKAHNLQFPQQF